MSQNPLRVVIAEDEALIRLDLKEMLEEEGYSVVAEAGDGESAVEEVRRLRPQVVLLDIQLPGIDGFAVAERLAAEPSAPAVVLISSRGAAAFRTRLAAAPARGFITKAEFTGECLSSLLA